MENLSQKDVQIYTNLPIKVQELLRLNSRGLMWVKSKYGMGYKLEVPSYKLTEYQQPMHIVQEPLWTQPQKYTWQTISTVGNTSNTTSSYPGLSMGTAITNQKPISDYSIKKEFELDLWGIPYFADDIVDVMKDIVTDFFFERTGDEKLIDMDESKSVISFEIFHGEVKSAILKIEDEVIKVSAKEEDSYRTLALLMLSSAINYIADSYQPSITDLKDVKNIIKDENGVKTIVVGTSFIANRMFNNHPHYLFVKEFNRSDSVNRGLIYFVEGLFKIMVDQKHENEIFKSLLSVSMETSKDNVLISNPSNTWISSSLNHYYQPNDYFTILSSSVGKEIDRQIQKNIGSSDIAEVFRKAYDGNLISENTLKKALGKISNDNKK